MKFISKYCYSDGDLLFAYGQNAKKNFMLQVRMHWEREDLLDCPVDRVSQSVLGSDLD